MSKDDFINAFKKVYDYDTTDELYLEDEDFLNRLEELVLDYEDDDSVSEEKMAEDVREILHFIQYGDTSDVDDLDRISEDFHDRFPCGR